ncbi:sigma-70 family RNA polymerase sigma factor [Aeromicrobium choanae]|uniref:RNA polymerase sigma factor, sigma-70 family n=1 Tax=Aeromicrobium choanae TaxID=1736691 RepID=A0A1T4YR07_9ACTN|nr:RNA polymerase sigma factor [Aeromicrobium choanae]SKB04103.1 RNA polymerase sigma factor, sigma-70 family [Aeromicrobium choanae]
MTDQHTLAAPPDAELVAGVRSGDEHAMAQLYERHRADALRVARIVSQDTDADDLAAEAFARVIAKITEGGGPTSGFRPYLHTVIRNLNIERRRRAGREQAASDKPWLLDSIDEAEPESFDDVDADLAARALRSLPDNWQQLLWKLDVQGNKPAEVARELSIPVASVSSTVYRAREGLRVAYLEQHVPRADDGRCEWTRDRLSRLARGSLSSRATAKVHLHLNQCAECAALYDDLHRLNTKLGAFVWPLVLAGGVSAGGFPWSVGAAVSPPPSGGPSGSGTGAGTSAGGVVAGAPVAAVAAGIVALVAVVAAGALWLTTSSAEPSATPAVTPVLDSVGEGARAKPTTPALPTAGPLGLLSTPLGVTELPSGEDEPQAPSPTDPPPSNDAPARDPAPEPTPAPTPQPTEPEPTEPEPTEPEPTEQPTEQPPAEPVDLGVGEPTVVATGEDLQWELTVPILAQEGAAAESFTLSVDLTMNGVAGFVGRRSAGWSCGPIEEGGSNGEPYFFESVTCEYTYQPGQAVAPLQLVLMSVEPSGTVTVRGAGNADPDPSSDSRQF